ncbi:MAG: hypothetical protein NTY45_12020 [Elusimicrobia bacterium]|nr:hypothetical protein [Elusimicrobiota bacterium]
MDKDLNLGERHQTLAVTVLAWLYIAFSLYGLVSGIRQLSAGTAMKLTSAQPNLYLGFNLAVMVSAIGALHRNDLARKALIGLLCLAAVLNVSIPVYMVLAFNATLPLYSLSVVAATLLFFGAGIYKFSRKKVIKEFRA